MVDIPSPITFWTRVLSLFIILYNFIITCIKIGIVIWLIYYFTKVAYPRLFQIGHTESEFDGFMQSYIADLINACNTIQASNLSNIQASKEASRDFYSAYKDLSNVDLAKLENPISNVNINNTNFTLLFVMFKYHYDLKNNTTKNLQNVFENLKDDTKPEALVLIKNLYDPKYTKGPKPTYFALDNEKVKQLQALYASFYKLRKTLHHEAAIIKADIAEGCPPYEIQESHVKLLLLDIMINVYLCPMDGEIKINGELDRPYPDQINSIERMYRARLSGGGPGPNFALVGLYMDDYQEYIFNEKVKKEIWGQFSSDAHKWMTTIQKAITNPNVAIWIANLPNKLAGEGYINAEKSDVVEHFFGLEKIVLAFVYLAQTLMSIINVITNPLGFIKFIIGAILALTLLIIYLFVCVIADIIIAPVMGYVGLFFFNIWLTIVLVIFFLIFYVFYFLLAVIDIFTGGIIMRSLRCENRPDAWAYTSNWMRNNRFLRTFFCSRTCNKRYYPSGVMCKKQNKDEPTFTPQQVIYQTWSNHEYISNLKDKIIFSHTPNYDYFANMNDNEKRQLWNDVYDNQVSYMQETQNAFTLYDPLISAMCLQMTSNDNKEITDENKNKIKKLCASCYCVAGSRKKLEFCKTSEQEKTLVQPEKTKKDIVLIIISILIIIVVAFVVFTLIFTGENKLTPNTITNEFFEAIHTHNQEIRRTSIFKILSNKISEMKESGKNFLGKAAEKAVEVTNKFKSKSK